MHRPELCYLVVAGVVLVLGILLVFTPGADTRRNGAWRSLTPSIRIPASARGAMALGMPVAGAIWALGGLYLSLGPALARIVTGSESPLYGGPALLCLYVPAAMAIVACRRLQNRTILVTGIGALIAGVTAVVAGVIAGSPTAYFAGSVAAGVGFGSGYYAVIRAILPLSAARERTGLLSTIYVICYLAFSLPTVAAGLRAGEVGLRLTTLGYGTLLVAASAPALVIVFRLAVRDRGPARRAC